MCKLSLAAQSNTMNLHLEEPEMSQLTNIDRFEESEAIGSSTSAIKCKEILAKGSHTNSSGPAVVKSFGSNHLDRLPDELITQIMNFVGIASRPTSMSLDPYEAGWKDQEEVVQSATRFGHSIAILRLVNWRFFYLATPLFFKKLVICDSGWNYARHPTQFILRLSNLLSTHLPKTNATRQQISAPSSSYNVIRNHNCYCANPPLYGHYVRQLIISNGGIPPLLIGRLIDMIHSLIPNVTTLSGLNLSHMPFLLSPMIRFPRLVSITGIDIAPYSDVWTGGYPMTITTADSINSIPTLAGRSNFISQEIFMGILNNHPQISHLACRGLHMDESGARRLMALLRTNQLSIALLPPCRRLQEFIGLTTLHIGVNSVIDLHLIRSLPSVAPYLKQLHLDAGCHIMDKAASSSQPWSLTQLFQELPSLTHLTFIAQHSLPNRQGSTEWASSNEILSISPLIQSLNLRIDSFTSAIFFDSLFGCTNLRKLNVWHRPALSIIPESWSIISFESSQEVFKLGHVVRTMSKAGLEWPTVDDQQRDLWLKLKALTHLKIPCI